ncbi:DUF6993 domain-containing protein [Arthrobacter sp. NPDC058288]|uniref:DUF6993 domain-containing protein n=1 Tax=Arthrobacter sp. NPDC058288 TaxID=3346424 RepID=UPI0036E4D235
MIRAKTSQPQYGLQPGSLRSGAGRRLRGASVLFITASMLAAGLAGCSGAGADSPASSSQAAAAVAGPSVAQPAPTATGASVAAPAPAQQPELDAATARLSETVRNALRGVAAANPKPGQDQLTAALTGAGIPAGSLQVSVSRTPTGLEVDAIEAAALQGKDCVIGQIRDGSVVVTVLPVLATGKCFVGG